MTTEEDAIEQANNSRRERLRALRAAKEFLETPDDAPSANNGKTRDESVMAAEDDLIEDGERLKDLRNEALSTHGVDSVQNDVKVEESEDTEEENKLNMKFRNYLPHDKQLQEGKLAPVVLPKFEDPVAATAAPPSEQIEDPFLNIAPKKPNWDLRRDVQKRLDKLERRTRKALSQLMQEQEKEREGLEEENSAVED